MYCTSHICATVVLGACYNSTSFTTNKKSRKTAPKVLGPGWLFHGWACGPKGGQPHCPEEDCRAAEPQGGGGKVVGEVPAFPWRGVSQIPPKTLLLLRVSGPVPSPGGGVLPCPALPGGCFGAEGHAGHPAPAHGVPEPGRPASARRSLPVGGIPRPRRAPPGAARGRQRGGGQGEPRGPGGGGRRGLTGGNGARACAAAARLPSFLSCPF